MRRGGLYLVRKPSVSDPKKQRVFVVVSRQSIIQTGFTTVICAPIYSRHNGLRTEVAVGIDEGLKHESSIHCDELVSLPKTLLTRYVGQLSTEKVGELNRALLIAVGLKPIAGPESVALIQ